MSILYQRITAELRVDSALENHFAKQVGESANFLQSNTLFNGATPEQSCIMQKLCKKKRNSPVDLMPV